MQRPSVISWSQQRKRERAVDGKEEMMDIPFDRVKIGKITSGSRPEESLPL